MVQGIVQRIVLEYKAVYRHEERSWHWEIEFCAVINSEMPGERDDVF